MISCQQRGDVRGKWLQGIGRFRIIVREEEVSYSIIQGVV